MPNNSSGDQPRSDFGPFNPISAKELAESNCEVVYLVENVLTELQPTTIAGPSKSMKTTVGLDLAISQATKKDFLGKFSVNRQAKKVLFLSAESGKAVTRETAIRIARSKGTDLREIENLIFDFRVPDLADDSSVSYFSNVLHHHKPDIVILDCQYLMMSGEGLENHSKVGRQLKTVCDLCISVGATPIVLHHFKKNRDKRYAPGDFDDLAWAGSAEYYRQWVLLNRQEKYLMNGIHKLYLTAGGTGNQGGLWGFTIDERFDATGKGRGYVVIPPTTLDKFQEYEEGARLEENQGRILTLLGRNIDGMAKSKIARELHMNYGTTCNVLDGMVESGELVVEGGKYKVAA